MSKPSTPRVPPSFAALVQSFFTEHLTQQRAMSPRTVATYRDGFVLFLDFAVGRLHKQPTAIWLEDITSALIPLPSSTIWSMSVATRFAHAMLGWQRCAPS